jgi:type VI secretion system secreted protein Hcp
MPIDTFLEFHGGNSFNGEAQDDKYKDCVEILSYSLGVSNSGSGAVGVGSGVSRAHFSDINITKHVDKSSPNFFICCANGAHIDKAILHVRKAGEKPQEYLTITMEEVFISSYQHGGTDGVGLPTESATLNFSKIELKYSPQKKDGSLDAANPKGWDVKANKHYAA